MTSVDSTFDKSSRLLSTEDFSYLRKNSHVVTDRWLRIYYKPSRLNSETSRVGFSVTKKVGKANKRNLCKRIIREFFRTSSYRSNGKDFMIVVSNRLFKNSQNPKEDLRNSLVNAFAKIQ